MDELTTDRAPRDAEGVPATSDPASQYDGNGVDLSLIRANMRLSPEARARRAERARKPVESPQDL